MSSLRRLARDHASLRQSLPPNYLFSTNGDGVDEDSLPDDLTQLLIFLTGAEGTPYSQGLWRLHLRIPPDYPKSPPKATFKTRIFHPNVEESTGAVCLETLKRDWDPKLTLKDILITISCLLIQPNPDSALNEKAGVLVREDYEGFTRQAKLMTRIHAPIPSEAKFIVDEARRRGEDKSATPGQIDLSSIRSAEPASRPTVERVDSEGGDSLKENQPSKVPVEATSQEPTKSTSTLGKRPLTEVPIPAELDAEIDANRKSSSNAEKTKHGSVRGEPLRKSPKTKHDAVDGLEDCGASKEFIEITTNPPMLQKPREFSFSSVSSTSGTSVFRKLSGVGPGRLRTKARIGTRRL